MYNNTTIKPIGKCKLKLLNPKDNEKFIAECVVIKDGTLTPLLGNKAVQAMNLFLQFISKSFFDRYRYLPRRVNYGGSILIQF
jgi:hypothetical protein